MSSDVVGDVVGSRSGDLEWKWDGHSHVGFERSHGNL